MHNHLKIRYSVESDEKYLIDWLCQPGVLEWFPLNDLKEVEDAARIWMGGIKNGAILTALWDDIPCGIANLYIQPYRKLAHQCLFAIIVDEKYRGKGVGTKLLLDLIHLGKEKFHLELIHLEVYEGNPAVKLYKKLGFTEYGKQRHFIKDQGEYKTKLLMQKKL